MISSLIFLVASSAAWIALAVLDRIRPTPAAFDVSYEFEYRDGRCRFVGMSAISTNPEGPTPYQREEIRRRWAELHTGPRGGDVWIWEGADWGAGDDQAVRGLFPSTTEETTSIESREPEFLGGDAGDLRARAVAAYYEDLYYRRFEP